MEIEIDCFKTLFSYSSIFNQIDVRVIIIAANA